MSAKSQVHYPGSYLDSFDWRVGPPLSSLYAPIGAAVAYVSLIFLIRSVANGNPAWTNQKWNSNIQIVQSYHNIFLASLSLFMFVGAAMACYERIQDEGYDWIFCENVWTKPAGKLFGWSYIYYMSKYYELLDTIFQLLKGRDPPHFLLHSFHHVSVLFMAYFWLEYTQTLQFPGLLFNSFVHIVMYFYYFLRANGFNPWWKSWVTRLQIVQFMTSFVLLSITVTKYLVPGRVCAGIEALAFNTGFNALLLFLFFGVLRSGHKHRRGSTTRRESSPGRKKKEAQETATAGLRRSSRKSRKESF